MGVDITQFSEKLLKSTANKTLKWASIVQMLKQDGLRGETVLQQYVYPKENKPKAAMDIFHSNLTTVPEKSYFVNYNRGKIFLFLQEQSHDFITPNYLVLAAQNDPTSRIVELHEPQQHQSKLIRLHNQIEAQFSDVDDLLNAFMDDQSI